MARPLRERDDNSECPFVTLVKYTSYIIYRHVWNSFGQYKLRHFMIDFSSSVCRVFLVLFAWVAVAVLADQSARTKIAVSVRNGDDDDGQAQRNTLRRRICYIVGGSQNGHATDRLTGSRRLV